MKKNNKKKILYKTITWRITASLATMIIVYMVTGEFLIASSITAIEFFSKMIIYYFHEKAWDKVD